MKEGKNMARLGITVDNFNCFGEDRFKKMKEYGFDYGNYVIMDKPENLTEEEFEAKIMADKKAAEEAGVKIFQIHGPWRYPPHDETPENRAERLETMKRSIRLTGKMGVKYWVIHPIMPFGPSVDPYPELFWQLNLEFFRQLLPVAKEAGVVICYENMPMRNLKISPSEETLRFVREMNDENFKFCLDTGHENVFNPAIGDTVRMAGDDLKCLHIHDNKKALDLHLYPQMGTINWKDFCQALVDINYQGVFMMETGKLTHGSEKTTDLEFKLLRSIIDDITAEFPSLLAE